jgi:citrate synthase
MTGIADAGLERTIAAETRLSDVQGQEGILTLAGYSAEEIAPNATFEEMVYLFLRGRLPDRTELQDLSSALAGARELPSHTITLLQGAAERGVEPMDALRMGIASLDSGDASFENQAATLISSTASIVAAYHRLAGGNEIVWPDREPGHVRSFLRMVNDSDPGKEQVRALETYLNTVMDHGLNASTFACRVIIATNTDLVSAVTGAVGALKGPLHGGAPGPALDMVFEIGSLDRAESYLRTKLERGERLMGFGHRVYRVRDPRADILSVATRRLYESGQGDEALYQLVVGVEEIALRLLEEYKPDRSIKTNVEYYTALLLYSLGFPTELFTPTFAVGRVAGWIAHCSEQRSNGRLIRPGSIYVGDRDRKWQGLEDRVR